MTNCVKARYVFGLVILIVTNWSGPAAAQPPDRPETGTLRQIELPMPAPMILLHPSGQRAVFVQWFSAGFPWRDENFEQPVVRVTVVDLDEISVIATSELPSAPMRFAVGRDELYVADNQTRLLSAYSLADLSRIRSVPLPHEVPDLIVVADKLLCSADGQLRLDLPDLTATKNWARLKTPQSQFRPDIVARVEGGWYLDGLIYDESLERIRLIAVSPLNSNDDFKWYRLWGRDPRATPVQGTKEVSRTVSPDDPVVISSRVPQTLQENSEIPVDLVLQNLDGETIARRQAGTLPADYAILKRNDWNWNFQKLVNARQNPVISSFRGSSHNIAPLGCVNDRILTVLDGRLIVWEIAEEVLKPLSGPFRFQLEQSITLTDYENTETLQHTVIGGEPPLIFTFPLENNRRSDSGELEFQPTTALANPSLQRTIINYANTYKLRSTEDVAQFQQQSAPFVERLTGRQPQGLLLLSRIAVRAADNTQPDPQRTEIGYYIAFEIPDSITEPILQSRWAANARTKVASEHEVERQQQAAQAQIDARENARQQQERERVVQQFSRILLGIGIPILVCVPIWILLCKVSKPSSPRGRLRGVLIAFSGLLPLLLILSLSFPFLAAIRPSEAWLAQNSKLLFGSVLLFMGLMFVTGTMVASYDKGSPLLRGFLLGLIAPLGLMIVILRPDETSTNPAPESGKTGKSG